MRVTIFGFIIAFLASSGLVAAETRVWNGELDAGARVLRFRIIQETTPDAPAKVRLISLDEGSHEFQLDEFSVDALTLKFTLPATAASYEGQWSATTSSFEGKWKQRGAELPLALRPAATDANTTRTEVWSGELNTLIQKLKVRFRILNPGDADETVYFDSISQRAGGFRAKRTIDGDNWSIGVEGAGGEFKGKISADGEEIRGTWKQGISSLELILKRDTEVLDAVVNYRRPQTPAPPFPYATEDVAFRNDVDNISLAGTLSIPSSDKPVAAAILISGSGPQDRDETLLGHKPFLVIADHLARNGVAVLRYDDRGTAKSKGDFDSATSVDFARDARAALEFLKKDSRIDAQRIGLIGHSEGGIVGPLVASEHSDVAFLVMLAGPGVSGRDILLSQGVKILQAEGLKDENLLQQQRTESQVLIDLVLAADESTSTDSIVDSAVTKLIETAKSDRVKTEEARPQLKAAVEKLRTPWFRFFLAHDPAPVLQKIGCPILVLNGELDTQVDPELNLPRIREVLETRSEGIYRIIEFPKLNHLFQSCSTGAVSEYETIEETISPVVLETITSWIHKPSAE